jgi:hypothetical protein
LRVEIKKEKGTETRIFSSGKIMTVKVKVTLEQTTRAQKGSKGIVLLFL